VAYLEADLVLREFFPAAAEQRREVDGASGEDGSAGVELDPFHKERHVRVFLHVQNSRKFGAQLLT
jgi:hypothetical protein